MSLVKRILRRLLLINQKFRILYYKILSSRPHVFGKPNIKQPLLYAGHGKISYGENVNFGYFPSPFFFNGYSHIDLRGDNAEILIGNNVWINNNSVLIAEGANISIGNDVLIGTNVSVYTSDFHGLDPENRRKNNYKKESIVVENNVFIGSGVTILKGVRIGENSVIGNGSIVTKSLPSNVIATGIPCRVIRNID